MKITGAPVSLDRFLEIKKAAEKRQAGAQTAPVKTAGATDFTQLIERLKSAQKSGATPAAAKTAPAAVPTTGKSGTEEGLLSVYRLNRSLSGRFSESPSTQAILEKRHLGSLFDKVA